MPPSTAPRPAPDAAREPRVGERNESTRIAWVERELRRLPAGWRLLDAGAGERPFRHACEHLAYVSQDFARYDGVGDGTGLQPGAWAREGHDLVCDVAAIPEPDAAFDAVLCTEVLEHVPRPIDALRELARVLKPGGVLIATAPFASLTHFSPYFYATGFSRHFWETHLADLGFDEIAVEPNGNWFEGLAQELRRLRAVSKQYAGRAPGRWTRWAVRFVLRALERASRSDRGSSELLCHGLHVRAVRTGPTP